MNQEIEATQDDLLPEYDFSGAVRGKHHLAFKAGTNVVVLDPDVSKCFKDSAHVNRVLRMVLTLARESEGRDSPAKG